MRFQALKPPEIRNCRPNHTLWARSLAWHGRGMESLCLPAPADHSADAHPPSAIAQGRLHRRPVA
jgi:hypothetical protein